MRGLPGGNVSVIDIKLAIGLCVNWVTEVAVVDNCGIGGGAIDCGGGGCGWDVGNAGGVELPSETAGCGNVGNTINIIHEPRTRQEEFISKKIIFFKIFVFGIFLHYNKEYNTKYNI